MAEIVFKDMDNYYISMMMNPDVYNFMKVSATINKHGSSKVYKIVRTMEYSSSFNGLRDRMYAGVLAIYNHMFKELEDLEDLQKGSVKNYFCIAVETANDFKKQVLSYDMYFIKSPSWEQLIKSKEYDMIPNVDNEEKHTAIFNFGYQYEEDHNNRLQRTAGTRDQAGIRERHKYGDPGDGCAGSGYHGSEGRTCIR